MRHTFMCIESVVVDVLAILIAIYSQVERLRQHFPLVTAFECYKVFALESLYQFEFVTDVIIGQVDRLHIGYRAGCAQADIVPINFCLQSVVYECRLLVAFVDKLTT